MHYTKFQNTKISILAYSLQDKLFFNFQTPRSKTEKKSVSHYTPRLRAGDEMGEKRNIFPSTFQSRLLLEENKWKETQEREKKV